ncbi:hypothetical protein MMC12_001559 [Toensbergia leucococca]|nr:hypothetical protein [Toensbergia leucococca]
MNFVYERAYITIVAAAGDDADAGLPGLPGMTRSSRTSVQHTEVVAGMKLGICMPSLKEQISNSTWATRAWTFQEGLLSKRYLVFTNEQVYWECRQAGFCEAVEEPFDQFPDMTALPSFSCVLGSPFLTERNFNKLYFRLVSTYSARELTYQSDILEAFAAVLGQFETLFGIRFFLGIPRQGLSEYLRWNHVSPAGFLSENRVSSLRIPQSIHRRAGFPSWTWAGWSGQVEFRDWKRPMIGILGTSYNKGFQIYPEYSSAGFSWREDDHDPKILNCSARTAFFTIWRGRYEMKAMSVGEVDDLRDIKFRGSSEQKICDVFLDCNTADLGSYEGQTIEFMECGHFTKYSPTVVSLLLIEWRDDIAERVGVCQMSLVDFEAVESVKKVIRLG